MVIVIVFVFVFVFVLVVGVLLVLVVTRRCVEGWCGRGVHVADWDSAADLVLTRCCANVQYWLRIV